MSVVVVLVAMVLQGDVPAVLRGIDTVPAPDTVAAVPVDDLVAVVVDRAGRPLYRARAARLLGARAVTVGAVDDALVAVVADATASGALRAQATLALAERAARRRDMPAVAVFAEAALADVAVAVARAGVLVWWWHGGDIAHHRLTVLAARPDAVGAAARGRLRSFASSGGWRRLDGDGVLDPPHGGPSPAR